MFTFQSYQSLGSMIQNLLDRNAQLEEENDKLNSEIKQLRQKLKVMDSPTSYHSESTDEGGQHASSSPLSGDHR
jgi:predicted  nucleic acid-binding Zn-ribbon protein